MLFILNDVINHFEEKRVTLGMYFVAPRRQENVLL